MILRLPHFLNELSSLSFCALHQEKTKSRLLFGPGSLPASCPSVTTQQEPIPI